MNAPFPVGTSPKMITPISTMPTKASTMPPRNEMIPSIGIPNGRSSTRHSLEVAPDALRRDGVMRSVRPGQDRSSPGTDDRAPWSAAFRVRPPLLRALLAHLLPEHEPDRRPGEV